MGPVLAAILWLAPQLSHHTAQTYAKIIYREAEKRAIDPLLVAAIIHVESSWNPRARSATGDWGLAQIHVSRTTNPNLIGHEEILFDPAINIRYAVRTLAMWRKWHEEACYQRLPHFSWSHYQFGYVVRNLDWTMKARNLRAELRRRFHPAYLVDASNLSL